jgi:polyferredoxin
MGTLLRSLTLFWPFVLLVLTIGIMILICIIVGKALCAWACPIGLFQDVITRIREGLRLKTKEFSLRSHNKLVGVKYAVLFLVIVSAASIGISVFFDNMVANLYISHFPEGTSQVAPYCQFCPTPVVYYISNTLFMGAPPDISNPVNFAMMSMFIFFFIGAIIIPRFWCRYFCPLGALSSVFNKTSVFSIQKDQSKCTKCNYCVNSCPTRVQKIRDEDKDNNVTDLNCDFCLECIESCPEKALSFNVGNKVIYRGGKKVWWQQSFEK